MSATWNLDGWVQADLPTHEFIDQLTDHVSYRVGGTFEPVMYVLPSGVLGNVKELPDGSWEYNAFDRHALNVALRRFVTPFKWAKEDGDDGAKHAKRVPLASLPRNAAAEYMGTGRWPGVPQIKRAGPAPVVGADLRVRWTKGYDSQSRVYVTESAPADERIVPSAEVARWAAEGLLAWFEPFAFKHAESRADCLALALTPYLMEFLQDHNVPGGLAMAVRPGSGKTELFRLITVMATGRDAELATWSNADEMRKFVTTMMRESTPLVLLDNIKVSMDSGVIESLLTGRKSRDRKFGTQTSMKMRNDTLWLFTKNNPDMSKDMLRRLVLVPLDVDSFAGEWDPRIVSKAIGLRDGIVQQIVALVESWRVAGCPTGSVSVSGYEVWSETVSGILEYAGIEGFWQHRDETVETSIATEDEDDIGLIERIARVMAKQSVWTAANLWDEVHTEFSADHMAVAKWLDQSAATEARRATGRKLMHLVGKKYNGCAYSIEKLSYPKNSYRVVVAAGASGAAQTENGIGNGMAF